MARRRKFSGPPPKKKDRGFGMKELRLGMKRIRKTWEFLNRPPTSYLKVTERDGTTYIIEKDRTLIYIQADQKEFRYYSNGQSTYRDPSRNMEERPLVGDPEYVLNMFIKRKLIK